MARHGAEHLVVMSRSGYTDEKSQQVLENISALDSQIDLVQGDVSVLQDVQRAFKVATKPIGGVIQGAMVLRVSSSKEEKSQPFPPAQPSNRCARAKRLNTGQNIRLDDCIRIPRSLRPQSPRHMASTQCLGGIWRYRTCVWWMGKRGRMEGWMNG